GRWVPRFRRSTARAGTSPDGRRAPGGGNGGRTGTGNREPGTGNREPGTGNREQRRAKSEERTVETANKGGVREPCHSERRREAPKSRNRSRLERGPGSLPGCLRFLDFAPSAL